MEIEVTEQDIKRGVKGDSQRCAIACAVRRLCRRQDISVDDEEVQIAKDSFRMSLPKKARAFVEKFDNGDAVKPFKFVLKGYKRKNK